MRSIIDEIASAEQQADEIRAAAVASARELVLAENEKAELTLAKLDADAREELRAALEQAERDGETLANRMTDDFAKDADALCAHAEARINHAIDYLLKKVQEIA